MNYLRRLLDSLRSLTPVYNEAAENEWTQEDGVRLQQFFASDTGIKLKTRLTNYVLRKAVVATLQTDHQQYHCGIARGVSEAVQTLEQHFARPPRRAGKSEEQPQQSAAGAFALS